MGSVFLASRQDPSSLFTNPAGFADLSTSEISFLYGKPYAGLPNVGFGTGLATFAFPTRLGQVGVGYSLFQAQDILKEQAFALSYAVPFRLIHVGLTVKRFTQSFSPGSDPFAARDPVFQNGLSRSATGLDAGALMPIGEFLNLGAAVRNINEPDIGLITEDKILREIEAGLSVRLAGAGLLTSGNVVFKRGTDGSGIESIFPYLGLEKSLAANFSVRAGLNRLEYTTGFGFRKGFLGLDYAIVFNRNLLEDNTGSHKIGVTYRFPSKALKENR
ncbi:MAG: type IX secretion system membrane protein PorP/SprF [Elusimicrobia bacterium]|nr:type IX secretion system membrane protein PorP/SprF [Elusimicrobiota bacterium]